MRRRILLAIVGVAAAAVFGLALPLGVAVQRLYRDDEILRLERNATAAARQFDPSAAAGDPVELPAGSDQLAAYSPRGRLLGGDGPASADPIVERTLRSGQVGDAEAGGLLTVAVPVLGGERVVGAIRGSRSTAELDERVLHARLLIAGAALLIVALAAVAALALSRRLTRPLARLAGSASEVGGGHPAPPAPRSGIAELDVVAGALDAMVERLNEVLAREREFSANASHQLRTPLAALRLELESGQLEGGDGPEVEAALAQVERIELTIESLLAAARRTPTGREPFDLGILVDEIRHDWTGRLARLGRPLFTEVPREVPPPRAARPLVRESIEILLDNAVRHGGGRVLIRARRAGGLIAIDVSDQGGGVERGEEIFARGTGDGHGIGLALARSLIEGEDGRLDLTDSSAGRTTFTLLLHPAAAAE